MAYTGGMRKHSRARARARDRWQDAHEPVIDFDDPGWVEWGGQLIWAVGFTSNGVPYGLTVDEFQDAIRSRPANAGWARARWVLYELFQCWTSSFSPRARVDVGRVKKIGQGLSREIFAAEVRIESTEHDLADSYVVQLPGCEADPDLDARTLKELGLLGRLEALELPFRVPRAVGALPDSGRLALVREFILGLELDLRAGTQSRVRPWKEVAEIAAAIHAIDVTALGNIMPSWSTRRAHAEAAIESAFVGLREPVLEQARQWALAHLPPDEPARLVHGDLMGQNILLCPGQPPAVIDWEYAGLGDPAYDLAIVTQGVKRPFQLTGGMDKLLDAYHKCGGRVSASEVHVHELCLLAGDYRHALGGRAPGRDRQHIVEPHLNRVRNLLRRVAAP